MSNKHKKKSRIERYLKRDNKLWSDFTQATKAYFETLHAFILFSGKKNCITIFGSARFKPEDPYTKMAYELSSKLARAGYNIVTGGGPGIMLAANRGAFENGGMSYGCSMTLPYEEDANPFIKRNKNFKYFFTRKLMLTKYAKAFIILPGGLGTLDEMFEIATLIKSGRIEQCPLIIMGTEYWQPLFDFMRNSMLAHNTIDADLLNIFYMNDNIDEVLAYIRQSIQPQED
jgi:uncharacterized protein (TIGR00730 family)